MQPVGPYQFIEAISLCQVGSVWSAIDGQGNSYTVAVLDATVAGDQRWRDAFTGTAHALAQPGAGGPRYAHADFFTTAPWVAYPSSDGPGAERLFAALGMECRPIQSGPDDVESPTVRTGTGTGPAVGGGDDDEELATPTTRLTPGLTPPGPWQSGPPQPVGGAPGPVGGDPVSAPPHQVSVPPDQTSAPPHQVSVPPHSVSGPPQQASGLPYQTSGVPHQASGPPYQISVPPDSISGPPQPLPEMPRPYSPGASPDASSYDPLYSPVRHIIPSEPKPRRNRLWIAVAAAVVLVLAGGGTVLALNAGGDDPVKPSATNQAASPSSSAVAIPTGPPVAPGKEPPKETKWPADWPRFNESFPVRTLNIDGLGFPLKVPQAWQCTPAGQAEGYAKYNCGVPPGSGPDIGGELVIRSCTPCDGDTRFAMRRAEEAWGLQWMRVGQSALYADSFQLPDTDTRRYGLVLIGYYRSDSAVDRQIVLRMTSPVDGAGQIRRVANYLRDTLIF